MENFYMRRALELARYAALREEVPVGAVVVQRATGRILGEGYNRRECDHSPLAHAEMAAIAQASRLLGGWRLVGCDLYVTLEPCPMCAGAITHARIEHLYYGTADPKSGAVRSMMEMYAYPVNWKPQVHEGLMQPQCAAMLTEFFSHLRSCKHSAQAHSLFARRTV